MGEIKALENYVIIKPDGVGEQELESGIILPELRKNLPSSGTIVDIKANTPELQKGVKVWYKMWAGQDVEYEKEKLIMVHIKDLIAYEQKNNS